MPRLSDHELWEYIREDLPYFDLTTHLLEAPSQRASLRIVSRHDVRAACTEEAARIGELLGCEVASYEPSGSNVPATHALLELRGEGEALHRAWRLSQILLEFACGLATYAANMAEKAHGVNPGCEILVTRKSFPFAKRFVMRALLCGGVLPHRLGLSESVLVFDHHRGLYEDTEGFEAAFVQLKSRCIEKKLAVESHSAEDAKRMLELGADVIQMDKCEPETLEAVVAYQRMHFPAAAILAAGGVNLQNVDTIARTGVAGIVTSSPYNARPADLTAKWIRLS